ncbi:MAG: pilus assembly protein [Chloroflexi bacterium]|nr:pilus assembly protein [Chloroflexota bacterium]
MRFNRFFRRRRDRSLGQSLVEFALILPVFLVIISVALDLGRLAYARVTIANVAREASFQAAQTPTSYQAGQPCSTSNPDANLVICRGVLESTGSIVTVTPADITLTCSPSCATGTMGTTVTVKATGQFTLLTPVMSVFFGGPTISFSSSATNQVAALPVYTTTTTTSSTTTTSTTTTSTTTTTTTVACVKPSAGFTYSTSPASNQSPVTVAVTDTSTSSASCPITSWIWSWGDGNPNYIGRVVSPNHVYTNNSGSNQTYFLTLTVANAAGSTTSGAQGIFVKK